MENNRQYYYGKSSTLNIGGTLVSTGRYPIAPWGQWHTLSDLEDFITDVSASAAAFPGMVVSVVDDEENNGVYMIWKVGADALDENDNTKCSPDAYRKLVFKGEYGKLHLEDGEEPEDGITNVTELQKILDDMDYTYSMGLTDLDYRLSHYGDEIDKREEIYAQAFTDLNGKIDEFVESIEELDLSDNIEILSTTLGNLGSTVIENEKITAKAINYLNDRIDLIAGGEIGSGNVTNISYGHFPYVVEDNGNTTTYTLSIGAASVEDAMAYIDYHFGENKGTFTSSNVTALDGWASVFDTETFVNSVKTDILSTITDNELVTASSLNDLNTRIDDLDADTIVRQDTSGNLKTKGYGEDTNYIGSTDDIVLGVGVYANKRRSFGWGNSFQGIFLTPSGNDDDKYTVRLENQSDISGQSQVLEVFADACIGGHILKSGATHQRVATIIDAVYDSSVPSVTLTLDSTLTSDGENEIQVETKYTYESKVGEMNFCVGNFMNSGKQNIALGSSQFVSGGFSITMGLMNASSGSKAITLGSHNNNRVNFGTSIGSDNTLKGKMGGTVIGRNNSLTANGSNPGVVLGISNTMSSGSGAVIGSSNTISTESGYAIGEHNTVLYPGVALGYYSKEYTSSNNSEKNLFVVGAGTSNASKNVIEQKQNGDLYITGIGTFNGTNSGTSGVETLQAVIADLASRLQAVEAQLPTT